MDRQLVTQKGFVKLKKIDRSRVSLFLIALPFVLLVFMFSYVPIFGWIYSFFDYKPGIPLSKTPFVGFKYFFLLSDYKGDIIRVLRNTLALGFISILLTPLPVVFAVLLNEISINKFKRFVQSFTTLPNFVSWVIVYGIASAFFSTEGMINKLIESIGITGVTANVLGNADIVWLFQSSLTVWKTLGWSAIIYLAAIAGIDEELYTAAKVDGAGRFRRIWHITIPGVSQTYIVLLLLSVSGILSASSGGFEQYFVFRNPMVLDNIEVLDLFVYKIGIVTNDYSFATVIGILKTFISIILLYTVNRISFRIRGNSIF